MHVYHLVNTKSDKVIAVRMYQLKRTYEEENCKSLSLALTNF